MLQDFIAANRDGIIERAKHRVHERTGPPSAAMGTEFGVPILLTQIVDALAQARTLHLVGTAPHSPTISETAAIFGQNLLRAGLTVAQVVNGYGDVCQVVTDLASEAGIAIGADEYHVFNGCLDEAVAGAVTAYGRQRERDLAYQGTERIGILAHEMRNLLKYDDALVRHSPRWQSRARGQHGRPVGA